MDNVEEGATPEDRWISLQVEVALASAARDAEPSSIAAQHDYWHARAEESLFRHQEDEDVPLSEEEVEPLMRADLACLAADADIVGRAIRAINDIHDTLEENGESSETIAEILDPLLALIAHNVDGLEEACGVFLPPVDMYARGMVQHVLEHGDLGEDNVLTSDDVLISLIIDDEN